MKRLLVPLLLLAMTVGVFWKQLLTNQYTFLDSPDMTYQVAPWLQVQAYAWHKGNFPLLWDPYVAGGQSLIGQAQPATAWPMNWILFILPLHRGFIQLSILHWYMALVHFFAALACYALCRDLGRSRTASILGASAYAFGGYVATTWWPQQVQAAIFAPLALMYSLRVIRGAQRWRNAFFSGFFLGLMWLGGHHQVPIFTVLGIAGVWVYYIAKAKTRRVALDRIALFAVLGAAMAAAGALQLLPSYSYGIDSLRWVGATDAVGWKDIVPYSVHEEFSQSPSAILGTFMNGFYRHANPFIGITVLVLAIAAIFLAWEDLNARLLGFLALGGMLVAVGPAAPLHGLLYSILPMVEKARSPAVAIIVFALGACPLAAFGLDRILDDPRSRRVTIISLIAAAAGVLLFILIVHIEIYHVQAPWQFSTGPMTAIAALAVAAMLAGLRTGSIEPRQAAPWFVVLAMLEIGNLGGMGMSSREQGWKFWPLLERDRDIANFIKSQPGLFRVEVKNDDVPYSFGDWYSVETYLGYTASLLRNFADVQAEPSTHRLLGVRYYLAKEPSAPDQRELMAGKGGIKVFDVPGAMPRAWAVHDAASYSGKEAAAKLAQLDLARATIVPGPPPRLESCDGDVVQVARHKAHLAVIDAFMKCRGMVILGDVYSKDWSVQIDGRPAKIWQAYSVIRGVVVEAGHHRIEYRYRPWPVYIGAALTFGSFGFALWLWLRDKKRRAEYGLG